MKRFPVFRVLEVAAWVAVLALAVWRFGPQVSAAAGWGRVEGTPAPPLTFFTMDGRTIALEELRGRVVLLNYWATWCPPCRAEMPGFQDVYDDQRDAGFLVIGVSTDDRPRREVEAWLAERRISYPIAMVTPQLGSAFGDITSLPTSLLIDKRGRVRYTVKGFFAEPALRAAVDRLLAE